MNIIEITNQVPVDVIFRKKASGTFPLLRLKILEYGQAFDLSDATTMAVTFYTEAGVSAGTATASFVNRPRAEIQFSAPVMAVGRYRIAILISFSGTNTMLIPDTSVNSMWLELS